MHIDTDPVILRGFEAIRKNDPERLQELLEHEGQRIRADVRIAASLATFAVRVALSKCRKSGALAEHRQCWDVLVRFGFPLRTVPGAIDVTPLQAAVQFPELALAREIIALGADPLEGNATLGMSLVDMADPRVREDVVAMVNAARERP